MKEKLTSRKFWLAILTNIVSIAVVFSELGGTAGTVAGIIGVVVASVAYMITECKVDMARVNSNYDELIKIDQNLKKKEGE